MIVLVLGNDEIQNTIPGKLILCPPDSWMLRLNDPAERSENSFYSDSCRLLWTWAVASRPGSRAKESLNKSSLRLLLENGVL